MIHLIELCVYLVGLLATFPVASRVVYHREQHKYSNPLLAYRDALGVGGAIAVFWPVAVPAALLGQAAMATARVTAPPEVKKIITEHNTKMLEAGLGMKNVHELEWDRD